MLKHFFNLQFKSFWRSATVASSIWMKVFMGFWALYFILMMIGGSFLVFELSTKKLNMEPLILVNKFLIYWWIVDLVFRYALQKMPVINIKPLLILPFSKKKIVHFALGKTLFSFFNLIHGFFFIPFSILLLVKGDANMLNVLVWNIALISLIYVNNYLNILVNNKDSLVYGIGGLIILLSGLHYFGYFDLTIYTAPFFQALYDHLWLFLLPLALAIGLYYLAFDYFIKRLFLDDGLATKSKIVKTENLDWLNRFGRIATFLKNDIKLIKRNKRSRSTIIVSFLFIFYGLLFFTGAIEAYEGPVWRIFAGIFVSGGFLLSFGQFVPSWDSSYYPLMMSQNIRYREYLASKWWLMVIATFISTVLASGYLYFGWEVYLAIVVGAIYNMGMNAHVVLLAGAYVKTPIDLTSNKKAFGDKQSFNIKTLMLSLPKLLLPMVLYAIGHYTLGPYAGYALVAIAGLIGFTFRNWMFTKIESIYKTEKYKTLWAYKQKK